MQKLGLCSSDWPIGDAAGTHEPRRPQHALMSKDLMPAVGLGTDFIDHRIAPKGAIKFSGSTFGIGEVSIGRSRATPGSLHAMAMRSLRDQSSVAVGSRIALNQQGHERCPKNAVDLSWINETANPAQIMASHNCSTFPVRTSGLG